ncbi:DNA polymerase/3'-5' exonuclease PolX [Haloplanus sp. GCM10025708]|uniref:DNA polymerase/3'-5' exonuclease PolX n=1 Tax=Haloferacaceae TaxID=1644056 RepID=UPI003613BDD1
MSRNAEVADRFEEFADLLEAKDVEFKPRSYRKAARNVREHPDPVEQLAAKGKDAVKEIDGVGDSLAEKILEYVRTGEIAELEALRSELPVDMEALTNVEGLGPKRARKLYDALGITTLDELEAAAEAGEIREIEGFGEKTEQNILENVDFARESQERELLGDARPVAEDVHSHLSAVDAVSRVEIAGSIRRWRETIGDVDALVSSTEGEAVVEALLDWDDVDDVIEAGPKKASIRARDMRIDLRVVVPEEFGSALQYFTGSKEHNVHLRNVAIDRDLKMNEYGVFDVSDVDDPDAGQRVGERIGGETEAEMYAALDMPLIPPDLREDTGEIDAARNGELPELLEEGEIRGDLHTHTEWSDGDNTVAEMADAAAERGYDYHCVSDHATGPGMVGGVGVTDDELRDQMGEIESVAADADIELFAGVEANIDAEGGLSVADDVLTDLDVVVASPHSDLNQDRDAATERLVRAVSHPSVDVLGHPTGRMIHSREGLPVDLAPVVEAAIENDTALEINASPFRLDLNGDAVRVAVEAGATVAINTDAHRPSELANVRYGVHTARRGWAETADVLNARDADGVREFLH